MRGENMGPPSQTESWPKPCRTSPHTNSEPLSLPGYGHRHPPLHLQHQLGHGFVTPTRNYPSRHQLHREGNYWIARDRISHARKLSPRLETRALGFERVERGLRACALGLSRAERDWTLGRFILWRSGTGGCELIRCLDWVAGFGKRRRTDGVEQCDGRGACGCVEGGGMVDSAAAVGWILRQVHCAEDAIEVGWAL